MADPLSIVGIAGTIAGLAHVSGLAYMGIAKYIKSAKDARVKTAQLAAEMRNVSGVLQNLSLLAGSLSDERAGLPGLNGSTIPTRAAFVDDLQDTIKKISDKIGAAQKDFDSGRKRDAVMRSMRSPFSDDEVDELLKEMKRHAETLNLALTADTLERLIEVGRSQTQLRDEVRDLHDLVVRRFEIERRIELDENTQKTIDFFLRVNPQTNLDTSLRLRQDRTGEWLTKRNAEFEKWKTTPGRKLWFSGIAGAGKTVLCGAVIQEALGLSNESTGVAFFFCDYKNVNSHHPATILSALAVQLALQKEACFGVLDEYYRSLGPSGGGMRSALPKDPEASGLAEVLSSMISLYGQVFIVVDGLDECGSHVAEAVQSVRGLAELHPHVNVALFSRDEVDIRNELEDYREVKIAAQTDDLELYIGAEMHKRQELKSSAPETQRLIHEALLRKANGMFRWVACQIDFLCTELDDEDRLAAINKFPETLNESYDRILDRVLATHRKGHSLDTIRKALQFICRSNTMPIDALLEALSVREGRSSLGKWRIPEEAISRALSSLIRKSVDGTRFELAHFTVMEYLGSINVNSRLAEFRFEVRKAAQTLAETSLRYLALSEFNKKPPSSDPSGCDALKIQIEEYPFYPHAANWWAAPFVPRGDNMLKLAKVLFHPDKKPMFLNWLIRYLTPAIIGPSTAVLQPPGYWNRPPVSRRGLPTSYEELMPGYQTPQPLEQIGTEPILASAKAAEIYQRRIAMILQPGFSTLHMAAVLGWPELCEWLCREQGADVNLDSSAGTPLFCALGGIGATKAGIGIPSEVFAGAMPQVRAAHISRTVTVLLDAGVRDATALNSWSFGKLALKLCAALLSSAPLMPFLTRGRFLGSDMVDHLRLLGETSGGSDFVHEIFDSILEEAEKHPGMAEFAPLVSVAQASRLVPRTGKSQPGQTTSPAPARDGGPPRDPVGPEIIISKIRDEHFALSVEMAVRHSHVQEIKKLIADPRFDADVLRFGSEKRTIVHLAAEQDNDAALNLLLENGCSDSAADNEGAKPIHMCAKSGVGSLRLLLARGISSRIRDEQGRTIYHHSARKDGLDVLRALAERDPENMEALRMVCTQGRTPLADALHAGSERSALFLTKLCPSDPAYYVSNIPIFIMATRIGSVALFEALRETVPDLEIPNPLHYMRFNVNLPFVQYLKKSFDVHEKINGWLAVERFLWDSNDAAKVTYAQHDPGQCPPEDKDSFLRFQPAVVGELLVEEVFSPKKPAKHVWDFFCENILHRDGILTSRVECLIQTITVFENAGVFATYAEYTGRPVTAPLLGAALKRGFVIHTMVPRLLGMFLGHNGIESMDLGADTQALAALRVAISQDTPNYVQVCNMLLARKTSIYAKAQDKSAIEYVCDLGRPVAVLKALLEQGDPLDPHRPADFEARILNRIIDSTRDLAKADKLRYLLGERGFSPNFFKKVKDLDVPGIVRAVWTGRSDVADVLLEFGANLFSATKVQYDVAHAAAGVGNLKVLELLREKGYDWTRTARHLLARSSGVQRVNGASVLHAASYGGQVETLKFLIEKTSLTDLERTTLGGYTPLHFAVMGGREEVVELLAAMKANLNARSSAGKLPLDLAFKDGRMIIVRKLLSLGAEYSSDPRWAEASIREMVQVTGPEAPAASPNDTRLSLGLLESAILNGDFGTFRSIMMPVGQLGTDFSSKVVAFGVDQALPSCGSCPALLVAARARRGEFVNVLLERTASVKKVYCRKHRQHAGQSPIAVVASDGQLASKSLSKLLDRALVECVPWVGDPVTCAHTAAAAGNEDGLRMIVDHVRNQGLELLSFLNVLPSKSGFRDCHTNDDVLRAFLQRPLPVGDEGAGRPDETDVGNDEFSPWLSRPPSRVFMPGATVLHLAAGKDHEGTVAALLAQGVDPDARDIRGLTPLMWTTSVNVAQQLLARGASLLARDTAFSRTPLEWAVQHGNVALVQLLVSRTAALGGEVTWQSQPGGLLALEGARRCPAMFAYLAQQQSSGHRCHHAEALGHTPTHRALVSHDVHPGVVAYILNSDVWTDLVSEIDPLPSTDLVGEMISNLGPTLSNLVLADRIRRLCRRLPDGPRSAFLNKNCDARKTCSGTSPLCMAAALGNLPVARVLLDFRTELEQVGSAEGTALMAACAFGRLNVVKELCRRGARLDYVDKIGRRRSALDNARVRKHEDIVRWLLVERHTEQRMLCNKADIVTAGTEADKVASSTHFRIHVRVPLRDMTSEDLKTQPEAYKRIIKSRYRPGVVKKVALQIPKDLAHNMGETSWDTFLRLRRYKCSLMGSVAICADNKRPEDSESEIESEDDEARSEDGPRRMSPLPPLPAPPPNLKGIVESHARNNSNGVGGGAPAIVEVRELGRGGSDGEDGHVGQRKDNGAGPPPPDGFVLIPLRYGEQPKGRARKKVEWAGVQPPPAPPLTIFPPWGFGL